MKHLVTYLIFHLTVSSNVTTITGFTARVTAVYMIWMLPFIIKVSFNLNILTRIPQILLVVVHDKRQVMFKLMRSL